MSIESFNYLSDFHIAFQFSIQPHFVESFCPLLIDFQILPPQAKGSQGIAQPEQDFETPLLIRI